MMLGPMRHKYTARQQADEQGIERLLVPRFTRVINVTGEVLDINKADSLIIESEVRNEQIVSDVEKAISDGRTPLVLTKLKKHVDVIREKLQNKADHVFVIYGDKPRQESGVNIVVITMNPETVGYEDTIELELLIDELQKAGILVRTTDDYSECYAVIDKTIVWNGGMNLLGKTDAWDNLIRIEDIHAAEELLEITEQMLK
ncbi:hypothetical protein [Butyrivibrio sp. LC3010]|uniref:hypothetical protein n=1 Tax=Butyrivibrio sp. LC3010 TaxID=1280680 RepID=UPI0012DE991A|nr:hypothetical protein [Butyrivibrio sp. LC3010]